MTDPELLWLLKLAEPPRLLKNLKLAEPPRLLMNLLKPRVDPELRQPAALQRVL